MDDSIIYSAFHSQQQRQINLVISEPKCHVPVSLNNLPIKCDSLRTQPLHFPGFESHPSGKNKCEMEISCGDRKSHFLPETVSSAPNGNGGHFEQKIFQFFSIDFDNKKTDFFSFLDARRPSHRARALGLSRLESCRRLRRARARQKFPSARMSQVS